jgi:heptaprenylglyceryl phosphate synthase
VKKVASFVSQNYLAVLVDRFARKFSLTKIDPAHEREVRHFPELATDNSDIFIVNAAKDFPRMQASTELVKRLKEQGYIIPIKKGDRSKSARSHDHPEDEG